jgi:hypothetical protein
MSLQQAPDSILLRELLAILANELRLLALAGKSIEDRVGDEITEGATGADRLRVSLQGLDHVVQTVSELSHFLDDIALETDGHLRISVAGPARRVRLRALAEALGGRLRDASSVSHLQGGGEVDLF